MILSPGQDDKAVRTEKSTVLDCGRRQAILSSRDKSPRHKPGALISGDYAFAGLDVFPFLDEKLHPVSIGEDQIDLRAHHDPAEALALFHHLTFCGEALYFADIGVRDLDDLDEFRMKRKPREHIIDKLNRRLLIALVINLQYTQPRTVIDRRILIVPPSRSGDSLKELHVDLDPVTWLRLLISFP